MVQILVEKGLVLEDEYISVTLLSLLAKQITVSLMPPFILNEPLEKEFTQFRKFSSGFKAVHLGHKDHRLQTFSTVPSTLWRFCLLSGLKML